MRKKPNLLDVAEELFLHTKNPTLPMFVLLFQHETKRSISEWVINWLFEGFKNYYDFYPEISLDEVFGFTGGRGKRSPLRLYWIQFRDETLFNEVFLLHSLGVKMDPTGIEAVAAKFKRFKEKGVKPIQKEYFRRRFYTYLKGHRAELKEWFTITSKWTDDEKKNFLAEYPVPNISRNVT